MLERFLAYPNKMSVLESFKKFLNTCSDILLRHAQARTRAIDQHVLCTVVVSHTSSAQLAAEGGLFPDIVQECKQVQARRRSGFGHVPCVHV